MRLRLSTLRQVVVVAAVLCLWPQRGHSAESLATYLVGELERYEEVLERTPNACRSEKSAAEIWKLQRFFLRVRPEIGFNVGLLSLTLEPEIELYWEKEFPPGWQPYQP